MADHLPECREFNRVGRPVPVCICGGLRAAQERGTARAYDRAVRDVREAVRQIENIEWALNPEAAVLAAINGLSAVSGGGTSLQQCERDRIIALLESEACEGECAACDGLHQAVVLIHGLSDEWRRVMPDGQGE
jgi:hypothetical protein